MYKKDGGAENRGRREIRGEETEGGSFIDGEGVEREREKGRE